MKTWWTIDEQMFLSYVEYSHLDGKHACFPSKFEFPLCNDINFSSMFHQLFSNLDWIAQIFQYSTFIQKFYRKLRYYNINCYFCSILGCFNRIEAKFWKPTSIFLMVRWPRLFVFTLLWYVSPAVNCQPSFCWGDSYNRSQLSYNQI